MLKATCLEHVVVVASTDSKNISALNLEDKVDLYMLVTF